MSLTVTPDDTVFENTSGSFWEVSFYSTLVKKMLSPLFCCLQESHFYKICIIICVIVKLP